MPPKKGKFKDDAQDLLASLGVRGSLVGLVRRAIVQGWDMDEFASHLVATKAFRRAFPGLVDRDGQLRVDFSGGIGFSAQNLLTAAGRYRAGYDDFTAVAQKVGIKGPSREMFAKMVSGDISLDEFGQRATVIQTVRDNPQLAEFYDQQLKAAGMKPLGKMGLYKAIATKAPSFYDPYQAAYFQQQLGYDAETARQVAKGIDTGLAPQLDLGKLVMQVRGMRADIGPELAKAGIPEAQLTTFLATGSDPYGIAPKLEQITAQRRALGQQQSAFARQSSTGGLSLFPEEEAPAY